MFVDTHAHLTDEQFKDDWQQVIKKARECNVDKIITSGFDYNSSVEAVNFSNKNENVFASIGVYPENIYEYNDDIENGLKELAKNKKVVAIGEIGLQYTDDMPLKEKQIEVFIKQLTLAYSLKKPIIIHCRDAYGDMIEILKKNKNLLTYGGTFHCYSGSYEIAKEILKLGFYISVGGVSTFKNAKNVQEMVAKIPLNRILLETDCPYLAPTPYRGKRNAPFYIPTIAENLAKIKNVSVEEIAEVTTENVRRLFGI